MVLAAAAAAATGLLVVSAAAVVGAAMMGRPGGGGRTKEVEGTLKETATAAGRAEAGACNISCITVEYYICVAILLQTVGGVLRAYGAVLRLAVCFAGCFARSFALLPARLRKAFAAAGLRRVWRVRLSLNHSSIIDNSQRKMSTLSYFCLPV